MRRPRGPGGRFLTAEEVSQMEAGGGLPEGSNGEMKPNGSATKRKAGEMKRQRRHEERDADKENQE